MSRLVLIDFSSIARPIYEASGSSTNVDQVSIDIVSRVRALASADPHVAICCDSGRSFRKDISPDYKAQRPETPAPYLHQCALALDVLRSDGFPVWKADGFEADDLIATGVAEAVSGKYVPHKDVLAISADKDLLQLVSPRVTMFRQAIGNNSAVTYTPEMVTERLKIQPHQVVDYLALVGDASDNIKGADGIGAKTAAELLAKYGNIDDLYAAMDKGDTFTPARQKALIEFYPRLAEVRKLLTLRTDAPIPFEEIFRERVAADAPMIGEETMSEEASPSDDDHAGVAEAEDAPIQARADAGSNPAAGTTSLAVRSAEPVDWQKELEPRSMNQAIQLANMMFKARLFSAYGTPEAVLSTILAGRELGLMAMHSLRAFDIIENKPTYKADLIRALVLKSGKAEYFRCTHRSAEKATFITHRKGDPEPIELTYTLAEAVASGRAKEGSGYKRDPADMCVARSGSKLARLVYPDVVHGLYAPEEME